MATVIDPDQVTGETAEQPPPDEDSSPAAAVETSDGASSEPADAPSPPMDDREIERAMEKLGREAKRHRDRLDEIMGEDALALIPCELCEPQLAGFRFPVPPDEQTRAAVLIALGISAAPDLVEDPETRGCDYCAGAGETLTGSRVETQRTRPCPKCAGNGWVTTQREQEWRSTQEAKAAMGAPAPVVALAPPPSDELPAADAWGRPRGHHFYGRSPQYMTAAERSADWEGARLG